MPVPVWALLGFAVWTLLLLLTTVGVYRWSRILTGRVQMRDFRADQVEGSDFYKRAMRAHANCVENLPVFGALVLALSLASRAARVAQSLIHVGFVQSNPAVAVRLPLAGRDGRLLGLIPTGRSW